MPEQIPMYSRAEWMFSSSADYDNPVQDASLTAVFTSPSGREYKVYGFWDGGRTWRLRFSPDEMGSWSFRTVCSDPDNSGLHQQGQFESVQPEGTSDFAKHGSLSLSNNRRYFIHADGTPFFWLGDTAWNGPLLATDDEWQHYLQTRQRQKFTAVQWVATQWLAAPEGDRQGEKAFEGHEEITINLDFFQRLERKHQMILDAGLLSVPVQLWAANWNEAATRDNPGATLPEDQAILLARYMVARWGTDPVAWCLPGDGPYQGEQAERWRRIGQAVFGDISHAPVTLHPNAQQWIGNFKDEALAWILSATRVVTATAMSGMPGYLKDLLRSVGTRSLYIP